MMMNNYLCPNCEEYVETIKRMIEETLPVRGEPITTKSEVLLCTKCGKQVFDEELDEVNIQRVFSIYRKKHNLLAPDEIKTTREKYGLSQRAMSRLLGWGEITLHRYEGGAIQNQSHDELFRLVQEPHNLLKIIERNSEALNDKDRFALINKIESFIAEEAEPKFRICIEDLLAQHSSDEFSGFKKFELQKIIEMILYFSANIKEAWKTKINKLLWYADFLYFKEYSNSISGAQYAKLPYGPVLNDYDMIMGFMIHKGILGKEEVSIDKNIEGEKLIPLAKPTPSLFSDDEIEVLKFVAEKFKNYSSNRISKLSHSESAFKNSEDCKPISYTFAQELSLTLPTK